MNNKNQLICLSDHPNGGSSQTGEHSPAYQSQQVCLTTTNRNRKQLIELWSKDKLNQLPINLFHSSAHYNKMIITHGKSLVKYSQPQIDGFIDNLEFINDDLFQNSEQKMYRNRKLILPEKKKLSSLTLSSCCESYSQFQRKNSPTRKGSAFSSLAKKKKKPIPSRRHASLKTTLKIKQNSNNSFKKEKQINESQILAKKAYVDQLVCSSLIEHEQQKRKKKLQQFLKKQQQQQKKIQMRMFEEMVRENNKQFISKSKSKEQIRQLSKSKKGINYWNSVKKQISQSLKTALKIKKPKTNIFDIVDCNRKPNISPEKIIQYRKRYEREAKLKIAQQQRERKIKKEKIRKQLTRIDDTCKKIIQECAKKKFKPSEKMIDEAFINIKEK